MKARMSNISFALQPDSLLPLYYQLEQDLRSLISSGSWQPGSLICSERELMRAAGVSRATVRQAIRPGQPLPIPYQPLVRGPRGRSERRTIDCQLRADREQSVGEPFARARRHIR